MLNAFLVGTKDSDHFVRASSLSNLGEVCKALGFRIGPVVTEVSTFLWLVNTCHTSVACLRRYIQCSLNNMSIYKILRTACSSKCSCYLKVVEILGTTSIYTEFAVSHSCLNDIAGMAIFLLWSSCHEDMRAMKSNSTLIIIFII